MDEIEQYIDRYRAVMRGPAPEDTVDSVLQRYCVRNDLYRRWLVETGGGPIGRDWYDGPLELAAGQEKLREEKWSLGGFVIGWDGAGNPVSLQPDGTITTEDHNFGGVHVVARSFKELLASGNAV